VGEAMTILTLSKRIAREPLIKLLKSAMANAENNHSMDVSKLYVAEVFANPGPTLKRVMPRAQGRAYRINKRTSHITITLREKE
ncbi:MAG: 50S ribosomal protein L22, partial [Clostridia bacterium]|nr:50S ribosomal protein L22 [Clostridia bacterium]